MFAITLIGWIIALMMLTGYHLVMSFDKQLKSEEVSDEHRLSMEHIVMSYNDGNYSHRVQFVLTLGMKAWLIIFFGGRRKNE